MKSPWEVLGLPPGSPQADIRAAYARLLKQHRPDVDPQGFRALREAFDQLRDDGPRNGALPPRPIFLPPLSNKPTPSPSPSPQQPATSPVSGEPGARVRARKRRAPSPRGRLQRAMARAGSGARRERMLRRLLTWWRRGHGPLPDTVIVNALAEHIDALRAMLTPEDLRTAVQREQFGILTDLLAANLAANDWIAVATLAGSLLDKGQAVTDPAHARLLIRTAGACSIVDPELGARLVDAAFRAGAAAGRVDLAEVELCLQIGAELRFRTPEERRLLSRALLCDGIDAADPSVGAVAKLFAAIPATALLARQRFAQRFPGIDLPKPAVPKPRRQRQEATESSKLAKFFVFIVVISALVKLCARISESRQLPNQGEWRSSLVVPGSGR